MPPSLPSALLFLRSPAAIALAALAAFNLCLLAGFRPFFLPIDDAYITLHNAKVLWTGTDPNFGVGPLVGATSPVHLAAVALLYPLLGQGASVAVSFAGSALYLLGVDRMTKQLGLPLVPALVVVLAAVGSGCALYQLVNGLETSLVLAAVTWAIVLAQNRRSRILPILCGALPFIRPELALLATPLLARQLHARWEDGALRQGARDVALALAAALPWVLWTWLQTGSILPNTAGAKVAFFAEAGLPMIVKLPAAAWGICAGLGITLAAPFLVRPSSLAFGLWGYAAAFFALFVASFPGGLTQNFNRYVFALLPVALWALCEVWRSRRLVFRGLAGLIVLMAPVFFFESVSGVFAFQSTLADASGAAAWVQAHVPAGQPVLIHDVGMIGYASDARLVDVVGLKTPSAVAEHKRLTAPSRGARRAEAVDRIARRGSVRYAIILAGDRFWSEIGDDLALRHWRLDLVRAPGVREGYTVYKLTPPL